jgi:hydrogenase maturation protease
MAGTAVIGLGNLLLGDEGVGVRIVSALAEAYDCASVDLYDLGTASFRLIHLLENRRKIVIVDCAFMGGAPGDVRRFTYEEARSVKILAHLSLHEGDPLAVVDLAGGLYPVLPEIIMFGVEPFSLEPAEGLSTLLERQLPGYLAAVAAECGLEQKDGA